MITHPNSIAFAFTALALIAAPLFAQGFPAKPITIVHGLGAGSGTDLSARRLADEVSKEAGVPVIVEPRAGANSVLALQTVSRAAPDGYTVLYATSTTQVLNTLFYKDLPGDPIADFVPVAGLTHAFQVMVVAADSPVNNVADFIARAKKAAQPLTFGSATGSMRMGGELFKQMTGVDLLHVPYKVTAASMTDLMGGRIDTVFADLVVAVPLIKSGKVKPLAVTALKRLDALPAVPTLDESGLKGYENSFWSGIFAPKGTPEPVVRRLHELFSKGNLQPSMEKGRVASSSNALVLNSADFAKYQAAEAVRWRKVAATAGIKPE
jgi:tripartite-type tricarboxylate transporter receptor subunit TctC